MTIALNALKPKLKTTKHLIHIGFAKAASTSIQEWFQNHPDICYEKGAIAGLENILEVTNPHKHNAILYVTSEERLLQPVVVNTLKTDAFIEDTLLQLEQKRENICSTLKSLFPNSYILIVTRGFKNILLSGYAHYIKRGGVVPFERMIDNLDILANTFDINAIATLYGKYFDKEKLIFLPFELLRDTPSVFYGELEKRLELDYKEVKLSHLNIGISPYELYWYPKMTRKVMALSPILGSKLFNKLYQYYITGLPQGKFYMVARLLSKIMPQRKYDPATTFPEPILKTLQGKADILKDNPLYQKYGKEYLWE